MNGRARVLHLIRWNEWYDSKLPLLAASAYDLTRIHAASLEVSLQRIVLGMLFCTLYLALGYMVNDFSDRRVDILAGKARWIQTLPEHMVLALLTALLLIGSITLLPFVAVAGQTLVPVAVFAYVANFSYSLPPVRLKERGILGLAAAAIAQRSLPILVLGAIWQDLGPRTWGWAMLGCLVGLRYILIHQYQDALNDRTSGVRTFATQRPFIVRRLLRINFLLEILVLLMLTCWTAAQDFLFACCSGMTVAYLAGYFALYLKYIGKPSLTSYVYVPLEDVYTIFLPATMVILLVALDVRWVLLIPIEIVWKYRCMRQYMSLPTQWAMSKLGLRHHNEPGS